MYRLIPITIGAIYIIFTIASLYIFFKSNKIIFENNNIRYSIIPNEIAFPTISITGITDESKYIYSISWSLIALGGAIILYKLESIIMGYDN